MFHVMVQNYYNMWKNLVNQFKKQNRVFSIKQNAGTAEIPELTFGQRSWYDNKAVPQYGTTD